MDNAVAHGRRLGSATDEREKQADTDCQMLTAHIERSWVCTHHVGKLGRFLECLRNA
jgi:hypothetical protein